jgi:hypothetical protein
MIFDWSLAWNSLIILFPDFQLFPDVESYLDFKAAYAACNNLLFPRNDWQVPHPLEDKCLGTVPNSGHHGLVVSFNVSYSRGSEF